MALKWNEYMPVLFYLTSAAMIAQSPQAEQAWKTKWRNFITDLRTDPTLGQAAAYLEAAWREIED